LVLSGVHAGAVLQRDAAWYQKNEINIGVTKRLAGYKHADNFDKPTASKRK